MATEFIKGESSMDRVSRAAQEAGLLIEIMEMDQSTRTAQEAADACGCEVGQIVKSLVFERSDDENLVLVLVSGKNNADMEKLKLAFGTELKRANPRKVRDLTGFAIGGVSAIGHLIDLKTVVDKDLTSYEIVWAAAGRPNSVFRSNTSDLLSVVNGEIIDLKA